MAAPGFVGAVGQTRTKQLHGCVSAGTSTAEPISWAIFSAELRFAWHIPVVGPEGAQGCPLILQLGPSQALPIHPYHGGSTAKRGQALSQKQLS